MLSRYDAPAIAAAMGIAFLPATRAGAAPSIVVAGTAIQVVEAGARRGQPSTPSPVLIEKAVEQGLPRAALRHVAELLAGGDKARVAALEWGVVPKTTLERRAAQLSPQESERTERVARLFVQARRALGSEAEARDFMTAPHPMLDGRSPLDAARTDLGTRRAERLLTALEYGLAL
jgi:putative toxin-antitoxin system antitoxin component (TIGR02293 family)